MTDRIQELFDSMEPVMGELHDDPLEAVRAATPERRDNRVQYDELELTSGPRSRITVRISQIYRHEDGSYRHTRIELYHSTRPNNRSQWTVTNRFPLEGAALETLLATLQVIPRFASLEEAGRSLVIPLNGTKVNLQADHLEAIAPSLSALLGTAEGLQAIEQGLFTSEALTNLEAAAQHARYKQAVADLRGMMADSGKTEHDYQKWFEAHDWVFGTDYIGRLHAHVIDLNAKADFLPVTIDGFVDVLELKRPDAQVLEHDRSHDLYYPSRELSKALTQAIHYLRVINENRLRLTDLWKQDLSGYDIGVDVFRPRAIIVIGRSDDWNEGQRQSWRNLKTTLQNIELLTFDHVVGRASQFVARYDAQSEPVLGDDQEFNIPF